MYHLLFESQCSHVRDRDLRNGDYLFHSNFPVLSAWVMRGCLWQQTQNVSTDEVTLLIVVVSQAVNISFTTDSVSLEFTWLWEYETIRIAFTKSRTFLDTSISGYLKLAIVIEYRDLVLWRYNCLHAAVCVIPPAELFSLAVKQCWLNAYHHLIVSMMRIVTLDFFYLTLSWHQQQVLFQ